MTQPRVGRGAATAVLLAGPVLAIVVAFAWPLFSIVSSSTAAGWSWLGSEYALARLRIAAAQALASVALTMAIAVPLAWLHHSRRLPASRLQLALHAAPFVLPVFVVVYGLQQMLGAGGWLHEATGLDVLGLLGPFGAVVLAHAYYNYGFAAVLLHAALDRRPHCLEEAAQVLGAPPRAAFLRTTGRLLFGPAALAVALLVFLFAFASFGTVLLLGGGEVSSTETLMYQQIGGVFPRTERAAALGTLQILLNGALLLGYAAMQRRLRLPAEPRRASPKASGPMAAVAAVALALGSAPAVAVLVGGFRLAGRWSLEPWRALADSEHPAHLAGFSLPHALAVTLGYAAVTVTLSIALTLLLAYAARRLARARAAIEALATLPLGASSLLLGLGFLLTFGAGSALDLRGWPGLVVAAHTLVAFPFTARLLLPALHTVDARLDDVAASLGASSWSVAWRVHRPLLTAPLAAAAGFAAALSLGDYGASLLLMRPDSMSLAVWTLRHDRPFDPLAHAQAVALAGLLAVLAAVALATAGVARRRSA
ncbi:MAG: ABC transporter permease [Thermoplasmatota archaeon]